VISAGSALVFLGDERGLAVFDEAIKKTGASSQFTATLTNFRQRLKARLDATKTQTKSPPQP
jgi:hypothetical protein